MPVLDKTDIINVGDAMVQWAQGDGALPANHIAAKKNIGAIYDLLADPEKGLVKLVADLKSAVQQPPAIDITALALKLETDLEAWFKANPQGGITAGELHSMLSAAAGAIAQQ